MFCIVSQPLEGPYRAASAFVYAVSVAAAVRSQENFAA